MTSKALKSAPMIVAVAGIGWCVWPYLGLSTTTHTATAEMPWFEARLFNPNIKPASERNPFVTLDASNRGRVEPSKGRDGAATGTSPSRPEETRSSGNAPDANASSTPAQGGWKLGATLVQGRRRAAVINGRIYVLGEMVAAATPDGKPARLDQIERDMVYLRVKDRPRPIVLAYADLATSHPRPKPAPMPALADDPLGGLQNSLDLSRTLRGGKPLPYLDLIKSLIPGVPAK